MNSTNAARPMRATHPDYPQDVVFSADALDHLQHHRQRGLLAKEAGGQLFGRTTPTGLVVIAATGPYRGDTRTRTSYRSDPTEATRTIAVMREQGLFYLGEWHTHPEMHPHPSGSDVDAFVRLCENSCLATKTPLLAIQGQAATPMGLTVLTREGRQLAPWTVTEMPIGDAVVA